MQTQQLDERTVKYHFLYLLETHDPPRALTLTSIVFKKTEEEIFKIVEHEYNENVNPVKIKEN